MYVISYLKPFKEAEFSKGIFFVIAAVTPIAIAYYLGDLLLGIPVALGVLLCSPNDVPGSLQRRVTGIFLAMLVAVLATLLAGAANQTMTLFIPVLVLLMFGLSMISVYGFRASLISFSGLFAVVLSMAKLPTGLSLWGHVLLIGCGGLWYLAFVVVIHYLNPKKETNNFLAEGFELTADFLKTTGELISSPGDKRNVLQQELFKLQTAINEKHETLRELVISRRKRSGRSVAAQKELLVLMELIDILELGMANPVNYERMDQLFERHQDQLHILQEWNLKMAEQLEIIGKSVQKNKRYRPDPVLETFQKRSRDAVLDFFQEVRPQERSALLVLQNLYDFKEKQYEKIMAIERLLKEWEGNPKVTNERHEASRFITTQEYDFKTLLDNLDFKSPIFRHSLRLTAVVLGGFLIGKLLDFQNAYWILLTSLVILRPGYALTRERFKQRLYGTLIGGGLAASVVFLTQDPVVYGTLAVITLVLAFSMLQSNYKAAAAFITLNVIFIYSLLNPDAFEVIQYRVLDTVIGAALAFLGNSFLWPTWEYRGIDNFITESIRANKAYLRCIESLYSQNGGSITTYKLTRKQAFLAIGNLNAAFQRLTQEPRSQQKELERTYEIVSLNQELLSSSASLGAFIRSHHTTTASVHFQSYMDGIQENLETAVEGLNRIRPAPAPRIQNIREADVYFEQKFRELIVLREKEKQVGQAGEDPVIRARFQEVQIVTDQLKWLLEVSENLRTTIVTGKRKQKGRSAAAPHRHSVN